jgi:hypothetical protein
MITKGDTAMNRKITKAPGAKFNSFTIDIKGLSMFPETQKGQLIEAVVTFTSDDAGETLSMVDPTTKKQIVVPFGSIEQLVAHTRNNRQEQTQ